MSESKHTEWCAGFFDGEGWLTLSTVRRKGCNDRTRIIAGITNTDRAMLEIFERNWGGSIRPRKGTALSRKPLFEWRVDAAKCERFLRDVVHHLRSEKAGKAIAAIAHREALAAQGRTAASRANPHPRRVLPAVNREISA